MSRRRRPHYRSDLGWTLGVAFMGTLSRWYPPAEGFTCVRCCGSPRSSSPHGLTAPGMASHDGILCVQLPPARGCYQLAPRRTFTSNPVPMPGTPMLACKGKLRVAALPPPRGGAFDSPCAPRPPEGVDRGRDAHYCAPPAQIRTCGFPAYGSHLGCLTAKRL